MWRDERQDSVGRSITRTLTSCQLERRANFRKESAFPKCQCGTDPDASSCHRYAVCDPTWVLSLGVRAREASGNLVYSYTVVRLRYAKNV